MKLLKLEYKKIVGNKSFWVFILLFIVLLPLLVIFIPSMIKFNLAGNDFFPFVPRNSEITWYYITYISSWFTFFLLNFVLIYHITNEYNYRTVRQNVIDGLTRNEYLKGKVYLMIVITLLATLYVFLVSILGGLYFSSFTPPEPNEIQKMIGLKVAAVGEYGNIMEGAKNIFRYFIQTLGTFSFAILVGFLVRKGILAILIFYSAFLVEMIFGSILKGYNFGIIYDFFPLNNISNTLPRPALKQLILGIEAPPEMSWMNIGIVGVYSVIFVFCIKLLFFKRDIS